MKNQRKCKTNNKKTSSGLEIEPVSLAPPCPNDQRLRPFGHDNSHNPMVLIVGIEFALCSNVKKYIKNTKTAN